MSWPVVKLGDVLKNVQPGFASGKDLEDGTLQVRMNNVKPDGSWDWSKKRIVPATDKQIEKYSLEVGDVLFNATNSAEQVGKSALYSTIVENTVCFSNHFLRLRTDNKRLLPQYLVRYLSYLWRIRVFENMVDAWVNQATVRREDFLNLEIPLPPLDEQKRIAAILDKADAIRQKRKQAITLADEFLRSVFLDMFGDPVTNPKGWEVKELAEVASSQLGKMLSKHAKEGINSKKYIRNANVRWREIDVSDLSEMDFTEKEINKFALLDGDLLVCEGGEVGRCAIWTGQESDCYYQKALHRVRVKPDILTPYYLQEYFYWMARKGGLLHSVSEVTFSHLTGERLKTLKVPLPPIKLQKQFEAIYGGYIETLGRLGLAARTDNDLFNALSQKAFSGQL